jgi:trigger factor
MFENRADTLMNGFAAQLKQNGLDMDLYLQYTGMDADSLKCPYACISE